MEKRDKHCFKVPSSSLKMARDKKEIKVVIDKCQSFKKYVFFPFLLNSGMLMLTLICLWHYGFLQILLITQQDD